MPDVLISTLNSFALLFDSLFLSEEFIWGLTVSVGVFLSFTITFSLDMPSFLDESNIL